MDLDMARHGTLLEHIFGSTATVDGSPCAMAQRVSLRREKPGLLKAMAAGITVPYDTLGLQTADLINNQWPLRSGLREEVIHVIPLGCHGESRMHKFRDLLGLE